MSRVTLKQMTKSYGKFMAVNSLDLNINDGEFVTLLGPSGCGKSTTLNLIAGLERATSGNIFFDDQNVTAQPPKERDVAMVFQSYALYPHLNVFDNIAFPLAARKIPKSEIKERVTVAAQKAGLGSFLHRYPRELSGGQRQRVALSRAIVRTPRIFLFDEPLSNLDAALKVITRGEIKKLHQELHTTTLYVTHDQAEALSLSDRIAVFKEGKIQQFADPKTIYDFPANLFVATFIGSPAMNLWEGEVTDGNGVLTLAFKDVKLPLPKNLSLKKGDTITLGVRPHQLKVFHEQGENRFQSEVFSRQPMGECIYLDLTLSGSRIIVRTPTDFEALPGEKVYLSFDPSDAHCFNKEGLRILS